MKHWTLGAKLTAWSAVMVGTALLVCGVAAVMFIQEEQIESLDDLLRNEAHTFFGEVERRGAVLDWRDRADVKAILPLTRTERFVEVVDAEGVSLYQSKELKRAGFPRLGAGTHTVKVGKDSVRLGIFPSNSEAPLARSLTLYLGTELNEINSDADMVAGSVLAGLLLVVGIIALGGWWLARKALAPVREIALAAEKITAAHLDHRLPPPGVRDEIGRLTDVLNAMFDRLDMSFRQAVRFSADASHELKTWVTP